MRVSTVRSLAGRVGLLAAAAVGAMSLASCGPADLNAMNTAYDTTLKNGCVTEASKTNPAATADAYCSCVTAQLDQIPIQQRIKFTPASNEVTAAMTTCQASVASASNAAAPAGAAAGAPPADQSNSSGSTGQGSSSSGQ